MVDIRNAEIVEDPAGISSEQNGQDKYSCQVKNNKNQS
jgi:hypothetical protein